MGENSECRITEDTGIELRFNNANLQPWKSGLIIVDVIRGFCEPDCGSLSPAQNDFNSRRAIDCMVKSVVEIATSFSKKRLPILAFRDSHKPEQQEGNYPKHCIQGTPETELMPELEWLKQYPMGTIYTKDCTNGFVGCMQGDGTNSLVQWINRNGMEKLVVCGICTDICIMELVLTLLSAKNHGLFSYLEDIIVPFQACTTYHLGGIHPRDYAQFFGFYFMQQAGAILVDKISV